MHFTELIDLAAERLGGAALLANDEFFAPKENLLRAAEPVFLPGEYTERGKWMDGWETRRRRSPGHDWCIIRLGLPGVIRGLVVDTTHFKGNYPEHCSLEACAVEGVPDPVELGQEGGPARWAEILASSPLRGDARNLFEIGADARFTHVRLRIYPDGGVARLRVYGQVVPDWDRLLQRGTELDLAAAEHGGLVIAASDMFFGHRQNLIMPGRALSMADGWETRRRRGPGHDWCIVRLGRPGTIHRVEVDTDHFKGNAPESCSLEGCHAPDAGLDEPVGEAAGWAELLPRTTLQPHSRHSFQVRPEATSPVSHMRFNIFPDGGIARLRVYGSPAAGA
ncbi:MAG: allantoicase [Gemmatimonadetes bacterium]|nr:allantoicase [Gemmatimonadota bacterium]